MMRLPATMTALLVIAAATYLSGCATESRGGSAAGLSAVGAASPDYVIGPGDTLTVSVYHVRDLSLSLPVRPDGRISMPLVTDMVAAGKTPTELARDIQAQLKDYVKNADVTVIVTGFVGPFDQQVRVIGEATQPLAFPYSDHMTLLDVMIEAKGLTRFAAGNSAKIVRRDSHGFQTIPVRLGDLIRDGDVTQNVAMRPGDTLVIPQTWF